MRADLELIYADNPVLHLGEGQILVLRYLQVLHELAEVFLSFDTWMLHFFNLLFSPPHHLAASVSV